MKLRRVLLISLCLLVSACTSMRDFYEAAYNTLQFHAQAKNQPNNAPFLDRPVSFQQYEGERKMLLESQGKPTTGSQGATRPAI